VVSVVTALLDILLTFIAVRCIGEAIVQAATGLLLVELCYRLRAADLQRGRARRRVAVTRGYAYTPTEPLYDSAALSSTWPTH
jgi:hypothetical protein